MPLCALRFGPADGPKYFPYNLGARKPQFGKPGNARDDCACSLQVRVSSCYVAVWHVNCAVCRRVLALVMSLCGK